MIDLFLQPTPLILIHPAKYICRSVIDRRLFLESSSVDRLIPPFKDISTAIQALEPLWKTIIRPSTSIRKSFIRCEDARSLTCLETMPRIPVRTTPYHTLPRCTRHYKSKRDLILRALGKASFINGSQFVIAWISPKGEVDVYASELLQAAVSVKEGGVLCRKELDQEAARVRGEMNRRWEEIRRLEESGEAPVLEDDQGDEAADVEEGEDEDVDDADPDRTFVEDTSSDSFARGLFDGMSLAKKPSPNTMMSTFPAARSSTPTPPMHTLNLAPTAIDDYYISRFAALQQATCKLVVKAWIKVIEPKKQMKFPYNKGEELRPAWWPEGVRHREPDHLSKTGELDRPLPSDR